MGRRREIKVATGDDNNAAEESGVGCYNGAEEIREGATILGDQRLAWAVGGDGSGAKAGSGCGSNAVKGRRMGYSLRLRDGKKKKGAAVKQRRQRGRVAGSGQRQVVVARVEKG
ncbi:hypothetical protein BHM03_00051863 [Ensete ventricosum]|nr:hypothetical protein BHM03_00051863 [Ensete ventricosum]